MNVEIVAQYIFSRSSRRAVDARKFDVSDNYYHRGLIEQITLTGMCAKIKIREYAP